METLYDTLKVNEDAPPEVIRAAYKALASNHHPDRNPDMADAAAMMHKINRAYKVLGDPVQRAQYDKAIKRARGQSQASAAPEPAPEASQAEKPAPGKFQQIWLPIILGVVSVRLLGLVGAAALVAVYFWLQPRKGIVIASVASVVSGITASALASSLLINTASAPGLNPINGSADQEIGPVKGASTPPSTTAPVKSEEWRQKGSTPENEIDWEKGAYTPASKAQ